MLLAVKVLHTVAGFLILTEPLLILVGIKFGSFVPLLALSLELVDCERCMRRNCVADGLSEHTFIDSVGDGIEGTTVVNEAHIESYES